MQGIALVTFEKNVHNNHRKQHPGRATPPGKKVKGIALVVHLTGVEPARLTAIEPKSIAYANFATGAYHSLIISDNFRFVNSSVGPNNFKFFSKPIDKKREILYN